MRRSQANACVRAEAPPLEGPEGPEYRWFLCVTMKGAEKEVPSG